MTTEVQQQVEMIEDQLFEEAIQGGQKAAAPTGKPKPKMARLLTGDRPVGAVEEIAPLVRVCANYHVEGRPTSADRLGWFFPREFTFNGGRFGCVAMAVLYYGVSESEAEMIAPFLDCSGSQAENLFRGLQRSIHHDENLVYTTGDALWASILSDPRLAAWLAEREHCEFVTFYRERGQRLEHTHLESAMREQLYIECAQKLARRKLVIAEYEKLATNAPEDQVEKLREDCLAEVGTHVPTFENAPKYHSGLVIHTIRRAKRRR